MQKWQCRVASSLGGGFAGEANDTLGTVPYTNLNTPTVFFGMYGMRDFQALWNHKGERHILWAGSDIRNLLKGYWLDKTGKERIDKDYLALWINENCTSYVENSLEQITLDSLGIFSTVVPSFLGKVEDYQPQEINQSLRYYTSVSGDDFELYGWDEIPDIAIQNPDTEYHLFGNKKTPSIEFPGNVFVHGRVPQEQMNEEIKTMTGGLRLTRFDGASEILIKSTLWGQKPLSPYIYYDWLGDRDKLLTVINKFPWVSN